jgi:hypothetical protein
MRFTKQARLTIIPVILMALLPVAWAVFSQDGSIDERMNSLESRVTRLEATVVTLSRTDKSALVETVDPVKTIHGTYVLSGPEGETWYSPGTNTCRGVKLYSGLNRLVVSIENDHGEVIGEGRVSKGKVTLRGCEFSFEVPVPRADTYYIESFPGEDLHA